ncbi:hypothetical protein SprV_0301064800 [Sparganum proliferum]
MTYREKALHQVAMSTFRRYHTLPRPNSRIPDDAAPASGPHFLLQSHFIQSDATDFLFPAARFIIYSKTREMKQRLNLPAR